MSCELVDCIRWQTEVSFTNAKIMLQTCHLNTLLCGMPVWKHAYHMLHSCDRWYINPARYTEPSFHEPNLNSLDAASEKVLSRTELLRYLESIESKILEYLDTLTDERLYEIPAGCQEIRLSLILSQLRHFYAHLGNINATTILETGQWPRVIGSEGRNGAAADSLYE